MICISDCFECKHQRDKLLDGWIPCCDAFPDGIPLDFKFGKVKEMKECNNGIGFEKKRRTSFICLVSALITER